MQTFTIMGQTIKAYELDKYADVVIRPNLAAMSGSDFCQRNAAILAGEEGAGGEDVAGVAASSWRRVALRPERNPKLT